ncbi:MAG: nucleotide sugar dehydrogenase [Acidaminococcus sp.]|jgi:UDP-N-acetyl-D-galactosamine dehydrogenase|nr:nucleotide sugar dehydrogenase [Acidaminococcus sp.]MCI2115411.1 nucleotide sugar dehydrogenase [Acidaminococcus sp.]
MKGLDVCEKLASKETKLAVVGLGYVGLPLAVQFSHHYDVVGFDTNEAKIGRYKAGHDVTEEAGDEALRASSVEFTSDEKKLDEACFFVISVPTPLNGDNTPDLTAVREATASVGRHLTKGSIVVYESTVYPGVTEDICCPILEKESGLSCGSDFKIGYSPERINPGDRKHRLFNIVKIVSGMDEETLETIATVYESIIEAGVYRAPTIKVAEAAKLVENSQRDINIALLNEFAMVFSRMGIETKEVIKAMNTKWNALGFYPGLVGGHCIGIDPYYFVYKAETLGYHSQVVSAGRRINNGMAGFVARQVLTMLLKAKIDVCRANIFLLGMTFKEDCPDVRNSRSYDVYEEFNKCGLSPRIVDPCADAEEVERLYGLKLTPMEEVHDADCLVFLVRHEAFRKLTPEQVDAFFRSPKAGQQKVLVDVKGMYERKDFEQKHFLYWSL